MHCRSCEILIKEKLRELPGVKTVSVSYKKSSAIVYHQKTIEESVLRTAIREAGYEVGIDKPKNLISTDPHVWKDFLIALVAVIILYFLAKWFGLFRISLGNTSKPSSLAVVLLVGLTAGFSTCMALAGGLILGISAKFAEKHPKAAPIQKFRPHLFFNLGRIGSYFLLGGIIGLIGEAFQLSGTTLGLLTILVGVVMLIVGVQLTELFPIISNLSFSLPSGISKLFGVRKRQDKEYSHANSMIVGALSFFMPCGFTQAMQIYAMSTGNFWSGALIMAVFALGTTPGLLGIGGLTSAVKGIFAKRFFKGAGIIVAALAIFNLSNGLTLTGFSPQITNRTQSQSLTKQNLSTTNEDSEQVIQMTQDATGYHPNNFTVKANTPVKWVINSTDANSCSASIYAQKFSVRQFLNPGENIINFTPREVGTFSFTCAMGMYRGAFKVTN